MLLINKIKTLALGAIATASATAFISYLSSSKDPKAEKKYSIDLYGVENSLFTGPDGLVL